MMTMLQCRPAFPAGSAGQTPPWEANSRHRPFFPAKGLPFFGWPVRHTNGAKPLQVCADCRRMAHHNGGLPVPKCSEDLLQTRLHPLAHLVKGFAVRALERAVLILPEPAVAHIRRGIARFPLLQPWVNRQRQPGMLRSLHRPQQRRGIHSCRPVQRLQRLGHVVSFGGQRPFLLVDVRQPQRLRMPEEIDRLHPALHQRKGEAHTSPCCTSSAGFDRINPLRPRPCRQRR